MVETLAMARFLAACQVWLGGTYTSFEWQWALSIEYP
jgi:hypothetical protein